MNLLHTVFIKNLKELDVLIFLLNRDSRITPLTEMLMRSNDSKFYKIYKADNYKNHGVYDILAVNTNTSEKQALTISEYINL